MSNGESTPTSEYAATFQEHDQINITVRQMRATGAACVDHHAIDRVLFDDE